MSNQSEDIQAAGSDTRPPMLDRTDFESWQQRAQLYYLSQIENDRLRADIRATNILLQGNGGAQNIVSNANAGQGKPIKCYNCNGICHIARNSPIAQIMFMANLFSDAPVYDEAGLSYDSDTLSE
nr:hypothetical protein [Tanacetum cinerariifolium]GEZ84661.1 hypothetical protein [Tanacetum cinerariifolium]